MKAHQLAVHPESSVAGGKAQAQSGISANGGPNNARRFAADFVGTRF
jgi:hypothetical protein